MWLVRLSPKEIIKSKVYYVYLLYFAYYYLTNDCKSFVYESCHKRNYRGLSEDGVDTVTDICNVPKYN